MNDKKLITIEDIAKYRPLSRNIPEERIRPYINEAQDVDLVMVLGDALHYDFMDKFDAEPVNQPYMDLLNGKVYTVNGTTINYPGIIPMLVYFSLARFYQNNQINVTRFGLTTKVTDESEPIDQATLSKVIAEVRSIGINYQERAVQFLRDNPTDYPLYAKNDKEILNTGGVKFFDV